MRRPADGAAASVSNRSMNRLNSSAPGPGLFGVGLGEQRFATVNVAFRRAVVVG